MKPIDALSYVFRAMGARICGRTEPMRWYEVFCPLVSVLPSLVLVMLMYWYVWSDKGLQTFQILLPPLLCFMLVRLTCAALPIKLDMTPGLRPLVRSFIRLANLSVNVWFYDEMRDYLTKDGASILLWLFMSVYLASICVEATLHAILFCHDAYVMHRAVDASKKSLHPYQIPASIFQVVDETKVYRLRFAADSVQLLMQLAMVLVVGWKGMEVECPASGAFLVVKIIMDTTSNADGYVALELTELASHGQDVLRISSWSIRVALVLETMAYFKGPKFGCVTVFAMYVCFLHRIMVCTICADDKAISEWAKKYDESLREKSRCDCKTDEATEGDGTKCKKRRTGKVLC